MGKSKFYMKNRHEKKSARYDFDEASWILPSSQVLDQPEGSPRHLRLYRVEDQDELGEIREREVLRTEHHVYSTPFRYRNVRVDNWLKTSEVGTELLADLGTITIEEEEPILEVTIVGSGCCGSNYNLVEWYNDGENIRQAVGLKRQWTDGLQGQHPGPLQQILAQELPEFETLDDAVAVLQSMQRLVHGMTANYTIPGSIMSGLYENTTVFRIADTSRPEQPELRANRVVIRGGGFDREDPVGGRYGDDRNRYPADYAFRLIDVVVLKNGEHTAASD